MNASDWVNSIPGVKPTDQFIALDRRMFEDCVERAIASAPADVNAAVRGITDDYMTSEAHHPGYVLIPTKRFEMLREAEASLASAPASQEAAFRAGAEAMQRALADALRDHLNSRAAAIANSTPLPEYPA